MSTESDDSQASAFEDRGATRSIVGVLREGPFVFFRVDREGRLVDCMGGAADQLNLDQLRAGWHHLAPIEPEFSHIADRLREGAPAYLRSHALHRQPNREFDVYLAPDTGGADVLGFAFEVPAGPSVSREFHRFFELSPDILCIVGFDGLFKSVNRAFEQLLGLETSRMVNRPFLDFVHPEDHAATSDEMQKLASGEPTFGFVNRYRRNDGRNCWLEWNALPFPDEGVVYAVARDVSAEHEAAQRIRELTSALQATERINSGVTLNDVLDAVYDGLHGAIPYNRVCIAKLDAGKERVHAECVKSDRDVLLGPGYVTPLGGSSLGTIVKEGKPRIIDDLAAYLTAHPNSKTTALLVEEGMRSSLTCPLVKAGSTHGFLIFSSVEARAYTDRHIAAFGRLASQLSGVIDKARLYSELEHKTGYIERQVAELSRDLDLARNLQQRLTPAVVPSVPGLVSCHLYQPALQVGGDILEVLKVDERTLLIFIGDAMGHGVRSALVMALTVALITQEAQRNADPASICTRLNLALSNLLDDEFVTATCVQIDASSGVADVVVAGHPGPIHCTPRADPCRLPPAGLPLGLDMDESYESRRVRLMPGDLLFAYTDGLTDAANLHGERLGTERLVAHLSAHVDEQPRQLIRGIYDDLGAHLGNAPLSDDVCMLAVKMAGGK